MEIISTLFSAMGATLVIVFGIAVQVGAGSTLVSKLDRLFEQKMTSRMLVVDSGETKKRKML